MDIGRKCHLKNKTHLYRKLFTSAFYLSSFTFGGGFVIIPLMKKKFVDTLKWIDEEEMLNLVAIAQSSPGAVAVNASILLGYSIAGVIGSFVTILGTILPPLIIISVISFFYSAFRSNVIVNAVLMGMQVGVAAVITDVVLTLGNSVVKEKEFISVLVMICAFIATYFLKINVIAIILISASIGAFKIYYQARKKRGQTE